MPRGGLRRGLAAGSGKRVRPRRLAAPRTPFTLSSRSQPLSEAPVQCLQRLDRFLPFAYYRVNQTCAVSFQPYDRARDGKCLAKCSASLWTCVKVPSVSGSVKACALKHGEVPGRSLVAPARPGPTGLWHHIRTAPASTRGMPRRSPAFRLGESLLAGEAWACRPRVSTGRFGGGMVRRNLALRQPCDGAHRGTCPAPERHREPEVREPPVDDLV
jgi:hypothetical protein